MFAKTRNIMADFYTEIYIEATAEKVWQAFVGRGQFFMAFYKANILSSFKIGDKIEFSGTYEGAETVHIYGKILEYNEGEVLAYTDHPGPMYHPEHERLESQVRVTFEPVGNCCRLTLTNDKFSADNPMEQEAAQWYLILSNLKTFVEQGKLMDLPKRDQ
jgi:uncharacterized protein YndB with AHSA1/START domain